MGSALFFHARLPCLPCDRRVYIRPVIRAYSTTVSRSSRFRVLEMLDVSAIIALRPSLLGLWGLEGPVDKEENVEKLNH